MITYIDGAAPQSWQKYAVSSLREDEVSIDKNQKDEKTMGKKHLKEC